MTSEKIRNVEKTNDGTNNMRGKLLGSAASPNVSQTKLNNLTNYELTCAL